MLRSLDGGTLSCRLEASIGFLYGAGARPGALGSPVATVRGGAASASGNPAGLAFLRSSEALIDVSPGLGLSVSDLLNAESRAASAIDDAIRDIAAHDIDLTYPDLDAWAGQGRGVVSGIIAFPAGPVTIAAAFEEPLSIRIGMVEAGIEAFAETVKNEGEGEVEIASRCFLDAAADVSLVLERTTAAVAARPSPALALGASLSRVSAHGSLSGAVVGDGIVDYGGQQYSFNDPDDAWHNDLGATVEGSFEGSGLGWTAGLSWRPSPRIAFDAVYSGAPSLALAGRLVTVENAIPAVSGDGVDVELISASQPTLTEEKTTVDESPLKIELPSYVGAALSVKTGPLLASLEYRRYTGSLAYARAGDSEGIDLGNALGIELDAGAIWAGGGAAWGDLRGEEGAAVTVPFANMGFSVPVRADLSLEALVVAFPLEAMRLSAVYTFGGTATGDAR